MCGWWTTCHAWAATPTRAGSLTWEFPSPASMCGRPMSWPPMWARCIRTSSFIARDRSPSRRRLPIRAATSRTTRWVPSTCWRPRGRARRKPSFSTRRRIRSTAEWRTCGSICSGERYRYADLPGGCDEQRPLDFHSPYGCSKGAADQYVRDYARIYGLRTVVFRQSCIYGMRQFGVEDQGWVAWFSIRAALRKSMTIYRRRQTSARCPVHRGPRRRLSRRRRSDRRRRRADLQRGRRPREPDVAAGARRAPRQALWCAAEGQLRGLAPRRPAHLRLRHLQGPPRAWLVSAGLRGCRAWKSCTAGSTRTRICSRSSADQARSTRTRYRDQTWSATASASN